MKQVIFKLAWVVISITGLFVVSSAVSDGGHGLLFSTDGGKGLLLPDGGNQTLFAADGGGKGISKLFDLDGGKG